MNYETSNNETEILSADELKVSEMCRSLKAVEAPKDFDFKLKARIANAKPGDFAPRRPFLSAMRYALPALAIILVLGLLAYNGGFFSAGSNSPAIAVNPVSPQNIALSQNGATSSFTPPNQTTNENTAVLPLTQNSPKPNELVVRQPRKTENEMLRRPKENEGGGSTERSVTNFQTITPKNDMPQIVPQSSPINEAANPIAVSEILQQMGFDTDFKDGKWTVKSVTPNSLGESSGVKPNDVIEEIDSQPVSGTTVFGKTFRGNTVTVTRNGQKTVIKLRNRQ